MWDATIAMLVLVCFMEFKVTCQESASVEGYCIFQHFNNNILLLGGNRLPPASEVIVICSGIWNVVAQVLWIPIAGQCSNNTISMVCLPCQDCTTCWFTAQTKRLPEPAEWDSSTSSKAYADPPVLHPGAGKLMLGSTGAWAGGREGRVEWAGLGPGGGRITRGLLHPIITNFLAFPALLWATWICTS